MTLSETTSMAAFDQLNQRYAELLVKCKTYRDALRAIEGEFVPGEDRKLYGSPQAAMDRIRTTAREALR